MKKNFIYIALIALLGLSLLLAACGTSTPADSGNVASTATAPAVAETPSNPVAASTPPSGANQPPATGTQPPNANRPNPNTTPGAGRPGNDKPGNNISREQIENATPEQIVNRFYKGIQEGELRQVIGLTSENFRKTLIGGGAQGSGQLALALGLKPDQKVQTVNVGKSSINGDKASLTATLTLSDGTKVTHDLNLVKGELSRPNGNGQGVNLWQIDSLKTM
jgi:hypothetical protein